MKLVPFTLGVTSTMLLLTSYLAWQGHQNWKEEKNLRQIETQKLEAARESEVKNHELQAQINQAVQEKAQAEASVAALKNEIEQIRDSSEAPQAAPESEAPVASLPMDRSVRDATQLPVGNVRRPSAAEMDHWNRQVASLGVLGKIVSVHPEHGFVVTNITENKGIEPGMRFMVRRNSFILGTLTIKELEKDGSIATLDSSRGAAQMTVQTGDEVVQYSEELLPLQQRLGLSQGQVPVSQVPAAPPSIPEIPSAPSPVDAEAPVAPVEPIPSVPAPVSPNLRENRGNIPPPTEGAPAPVSKTPMGGIR